MTLITIFCLTCISLAFIKGLFTLLDFFDDGYDYGPITVWDAQLDEMKEIKNELREIKKKLKENG